MIMMKNFTKYTIKLLILGILCLPLANCMLRPYRFDIQQGNIVEQEKVDKVQVRMNQDQVRFIMGTSMLQDVFHPDRWDYVYYLKPRQGEIQKKHTVIYFKNGLVERVVHYPES